MDASLTLKYLNCFKIAFCIYTSYDDFCLILSMMGSDYHTFHMAGTWHQDWESLGFREMAMNEYKTEAPTESYLTRSYRKLMSDFHTHL